MSRKTFSVATFTTRVNHVLATDTGLPAEARQTLMTQLEAILHETGNYNGFAYLDARELPKGVTPGINDYETLRLETHADIMSAADMFKNTDRTRVKYF